MPVPVGHGEINEARHEQSSDTPDSGRYGLRADADTRNLFRSKRHTVRTQPSGLFRRAIIEQHRKGEFFLDVSRESFACPTVNEPPAVSSCLWAYWGSPTC